LFQVVTGTFACGQMMLKYGYKRTEEKVFKVHEESGSSLTRELPKERLGHIFRVRGALDKRRWSLQHTMRASGSCYMKSICMGRRTVT
jgi:hypothetical protein